MYDNRIVKFKLRRGTNDQRVQVTFNSGEVVYTSDIKRCYVGDGNTLGGVPFSGRNFISTTFPALVELGDCIYRTDLQRTYLNSDTGPQYLGPVPDDITIHIPSNTLQVVPGSITRSKLYPRIVQSRGGLVFTNVNGLSINTSAPFFINASKQLSLDTSSKVIKVASNHNISVQNITLTNASLSTFLGTLTATGTFLIINVNGVQQGIKLWKLPLINKPSPPIKPPVTPSRDEFILAEDLSPVISNVGDNVVWTVSYRNYLITEDGSYIMTEATDDITWET